jgi:Holliday junction resolvase RusA-like endonuclease
MNKTYILHGFPLSPSINASLRPSKTTKQFIKTDQMNIWEDKVFIWKLKNGALLHDIYEHQKVYKGPLKIDFVFVFHKPRIINKEGTIKTAKNDCNNFLKNSLDAFCKLIGIDDSRANKHTIERAICENESDQQTLIRIEPCEIQVYDKQKEFGGIKW